MATVLKTRVFHAGVNTAQAEVFNWEDVAARAKEYLDSVRAEGRQLIEKCQRECEQLRARAVEEGKNVGEAHVERLAHQIANQVATDRVQSASQSIQHVCDDLERATFDWLREWQHETVAMAVGIAEKLMMKQMSHDSSILLKWIEDTVRLVHGQKRITIRLHSEDALILSSAIPELLEKIAPDVEIQIIDDPTVGRCGVVIQTPDTTIDRTIAAQLKRLEQELG
jgi:flagellar assembly protein FliH